VNISFCLITHNEEDNLPRCLESLKGVAREIVVVDSVSTDGTVQIARAAGAAVFSEDWKGFVEQKNSAARKASNPWVFSIDADEELSPELRESLLRLAEGPEPAPGSGFLVSRCVFYDGRWIRHGDWYPDWVLRLFHRDHGRFTGGLVHERVAVDGPLVRLQGELRHYSFKDTQDHLARIERYAGLWAETQRAAGHTAGPVAPFLHATAKFLRGYLVRGGFLDGATGFKIARLTAYETFLKYSKLRKAWHP